jgi:biotin transporter BioY
MLEHLGNPEYLHVLLNPLPIYGLAMGVIAIVVALACRARAARVTALIIVFISGFSAWPVYHYGESGYDRVLSMADTDGTKWLEEHQRRGEQLIYIFYAVAALAALGLVAEKSFPRAATPLTIATLFVAIVSLGLGSYIAQAGGRIRHREFRYVPPPSSTPD